MLGTQSAMALSFGSTAMIDKLLLKLIMLIQLAAEAVLSLWSHGKDEHCFSTDLLVGSHCPTLLLHLVDPLVVKLFKQIISNHEREMAGHTVN